MCTRACVGANPFCFITRWFETISIGLASQWPKALDYEVHGRWIESHCGFEFFLYLVCTIIQFVLLRNPQHVRLIFCFNLQWATRPRCNVQDLRAQHPTKFLASTCSGQQVHVVHMQDLRAQDPTRQKMCTCGCVVTLSV
jgi:hypothetical protein